MNSLEIFDAGMRGPYKDDKAINFIESEERARIKAENQNDMKKFLEKKHKAFQKGGKNYGRRY